jgi:hypothetical protein
MMGRHSLLEKLNPVRKGLVKRPEDGRWSSYNNFALDKVTVAACPIQIVYVRLPLGYRARKKPIVSEPLAVARSTSESAPHGVPNLRSNYRFRVRT